MATHDTATSPIRGRAPCQDGGVFGDLVVRPGVTIPSGELQWRFSHSGGPGGQGVNTSDSRVELTWDLGATSALTPALKRAGAGEARQPARRHLGHRGLVGVPRPAAQPRSRRRPARRPRRPGHRPAAAGPAGATRPTAHAVERAHRRQEAPQPSEANPPPRRRRLSYAAAEDAGRSRPTAVVGPGSRLASRTADAADGAGVVR